MKKTALLLLLCMAVQGATCQQIRNLIYLIGDGMGLAHVSMLRIENGYEPTAFDRAQHVALISSQSANNRVTDSAAAGTALATGHKANNGSLGQLPDGTPVQSLVATAARRDFATGLAVTCYLQHATPAAFYAHTGRRGDLRHITRDMLASDIDVLLGGGRRWLAEEESAGRTYLDAFRQRGYRIAERMADTDAVHEGRLLGVFAEEELPDIRTRDTSYLAAATAKALEILSNNVAKGDRGLVLMVEGSHIDYAAHRNDAPWLLEELRDFERAVRTAMDFADRTPGTLVVVTADRETGGLSIPSCKTDFTQAESGIQYDFGSTSHTGSMLPVFFYGEGADRISGILDNTELPRRLAQLLGLELQDE